MLEKLSNKIKSKLKKNSKVRGVTFSDKELFEVGTKFKYVVTADKLLIVKSDTFDQIAESLNLDNEKAFDGTVSKKGSKQVPLIDIRRKEVLSTFGKADTLIVDIYGDFVTVTGYEQVEIASSPKKDNLSFVQKIADKVLHSKKVFNLSETKLRKKFEVRMEKSSFDKAVGEQLSLFEDFHFQSSSLQTANINSYVKEAFENIGIPLQIASFFSGSGIFDAGLKEAGFEIVFALEKDEAAAQTYLYNHGDHILCGDIKTFDKSLVRGIPIFAGGPPCQGFSNSNRHTHFLDNENNLLVREYIRTIQSNPDCKIFILENVPQILTAGDGLFKDEILNELSDFEITYGIMNAADYGCAQLRKRAIFIGSKIGRINLPKPTHSEETYVTVKEAFEGISDFAPNQNDWSKPRKDTLQRMKHIKQGENWEVLPPELRTERMASGNTHSNIFRRLDENKPSITIANPRKSNILHPTLNRILSVRECARLFGLKDDFTFLGTLSEKQQQVANGVPAQIGYAIGKVVRKAIEQFNIRMGYAKPQLV